MEDRMRNLKKGIAGIIEDAPVYLFFGAEEGDNGGEPPKVTEGPEIEPEDDDDDDDDGDDDAVDDAVAKVKRRLRTTTKESMKRKALLAEQAARIAELEAGQTEAERKKNDDLTNYKNDLEKTKADNEVLSTVLRRNLLETAILKDTKRIWHDVTSVIANLDLEDITIDLKSGKVEGLEQPLADLAKDKAFLVKEAKGKQKGSGENDQNPNGGAQGQQQPRGSSGNNPAGAGQQLPAQANRDALTKRIPALRGR